jgi:hypothetical protein
MSARHCGCLSCAHACVRAEGSRSNAATEQMHAGVTRCARREAVSRAALMRQQCAAVHLSASSPFVASLLYASHSAAAHQPTPRVLAVCAAFMSQSTVGCVLPSLTRGAEGAVVPGVRWRVRHDSTSSRAGSRCTLKDGLRSGTSLSCCRAKPTACATCCRVTQVSKGRRGGTQGGAVKVTGVRGWVAQGGAHGLCGPLQRDGGKGRWR